MQYLSKVIFVPALLDVPNLEERINAAGKEGYKPSLTLGGSYIIATKAVPEANVTTYGSDSYTADREDNPS